MRSWTETDEPRRRETDDGDQVPRPVVLRAERGRDHGPDRPVPQAQQPGRGGHRRGGRADPHRAHPRPRRPHRRRRSRSPSAPAPTASRSSSSPSGSKARGRGRSATPTSAAPSTSTGARSSSSPPGTPTRSPAPKSRPSAPSTGSSIGPAAGLVIKHRRHHRLPRRRHLPLRRHEADRRAQPGRRRPAADRRPLHDGSPRRRASPPSSIGAGTVIPMHYDTFPPIETDPQAFKSDVEAKTSSSVVVLEPGESHTTG